MAHELGHSLCIEHDFKAKSARYDKNNNPCSKIGGIMDYSGENLKDKSLWTTCSSEDFTKMLVAYPNCMAIATPENIPAATNYPPTVRECRLPPAYSEYRGYLTINLNGKFSLLLFYST